jgi:hypothetical protein
MTTPVRGPVMALRPSRNARVIGRQLTPGLSPDMAVATYELKTTG